LPAFSCAYLNNYEEIVRKASVNVSAPGEGKIMKKIDFTAETGFINQENS
jgi:hypothetical protein